MASGLALASAAFFLWNAVRPAWFHPSGDFPNYYVAARLLRDHKPLESFYDWPLFQRETIRAGFGLRLGGYVPQTPLAMLPFVPLSLLDPQTARKVWVIVNLVFLGATLFLITKITRFRLSQAWLIALLSYPAIRSNFILGQYYVLLLALIALAAYSLHRGRGRRAGLLCASAAILKMYGIPLLAFFALSRKSRAAVWMASAILASLLLAALFFGWHGLEYYARIILPRAISGETLDPYNPGNGSAATLLRRLFVSEPELNPHPLLDSPRIFAFVWSGFVSLILSFPVLATMRCTRRDAMTNGANAEPTTALFAFWLVAILLISPNTASYTFALLPLAATLLLDALPFRRSLAFAALNALIALPLWPSWRMAFPRAWLLLLAFIVAGWDHIRATTRRQAAAAAFAICGAGFLTALFFADANPPGTVAALEPGAIYSGHAAAFHDGIAYESIGYERYELKMARSASITTFEFPGHAFHPSAPDSGWPVYFETVDPVRRVMALPYSTLGRDIPTGMTGFAVSHQGDSVAFASPDGLYVAHEGSQRRFGPIDHARDLSFVPGDAAILYAAGAADRQRIESIELSSGRFKVLVSGPESLAHPSLSSHLHALAFAHRRPGHNWAVRLQTTAGSILADIAPAGCNCYDPTWIPGSDELVYSTDCRRGVLLPRLMRAHAGPLLHHLKN